MCLCAGDRHVLSLSLHSLAIDSRPHTEKVVCLRGLVGHCATLTHSLSFSLSLLCLWFPTCNVSLLRPLSVHSFSHCLCSLVCCFSRRWCYFDLHTTAAADKVRSWSSSRHRRRRSVDCHVQKLWLLYANTLPEDTYKYILMRFSKICSCFNFTTLDRPAGLSPATTTHRNTLSD